jgi:hypothetical protein
VPPAEREVSRAFRRSTEKLRSETRHTQFSGCSSWIAREGQQRAIVIAYPVSTFIARLAPVER